MGATGILGPDDRVELVDGEIIAKAPIGGPHASRVLRLNRLFSAALADVAYVHVQSPLRLSNVSEPVPDVMLLRPRPDFYVEHPTPSDVLLLVEVSDTSLAYDRGRKLPLYAREGVPEVWLVEIGPGTISVHREPSPAGYCISETRGRGEPLAPSAFPDAVFNVDDILGR
ncbi:MAG: Uma2 family endonuclease [Chloroflexi bacterium]|nr:Uma2 family endonuclease [Chloroflexota bacterium]